MGDKGRRIRCPRSFLAIQPVGPCETLFTKAKIGLGREITEPNASYSSTEFKSSELTESWTYRWYYKSVIPKWGLGVGWGRDKIPKPSGSDCLS